MEGSWTIREMIWEREVIVEKWETGKGRCNRERRRETHLWVRFGQALSETSSEDELLKSSGESNTEDLPERSKETETTVSGEH